MRKALAGWEHVVVPDEGRCSMINGVVGAADRRPVRHLVRFTLHQLLGKDVELFSVEHP
jgi:hypothetical protein